jgi:hypothetical protein
MNNIFCESLESLYIFTKYNTLCLQQEFRIGRQPVLEFKYKSVKDLITKINIIYEYCLCKRPGWGLVPGGFFRRDSLNMIVVSETVFSVVPINRSKYD